MLKQLYATWALCLIAMLGFAQDHVTIRVLDQNKNPLAGANVTIHSTTRLTNEDGMASFQNLENKNYTVQVSFVGYRENNLKFNPSRTNHVQVVLQPNLVAVADVFVYATRAKENSATTFKNLSKEDIAVQNLGQDLPYLLDQTPGVVIGSDAGAGIGYTSMRIRGSDNQRINVTLNGIPLNDAESMGSFFVNLPDFASSAESIQIQRGIGTSTNGAGAFGASLNIQTDALEQQPYAELNNSFGSFNSWKNTVKAGTGLINNKYAFNTRLSRITSDGYVDRASSDLKSFYVDGGLYTAKHTLKATIFSGKEKTYQAWNGVPEPLVQGDESGLKDFAVNGLGYAEGSPEYVRLLESGRTYNMFTYDNQTDNYTQTHAHLHYTSTLSEQWNIQAALHYTRGAGYYEEYYENEDLAYYGLSNINIGGETIEQTNLVRRRWLDNHFYGGTYSVNYTPSANFNFILGGAYNQYLGDHYGEVIWAQYASNGNLGDKYYFNDAKKNDFNIYGKADYRFGKWLANLDLQYRNLYYKGNGVEDGDDPVDFEANLNFFNPKAGVTYFLNNLSNVYLSYAFANKEPVRKDYVNSTGGTLPKPEKLHDIEGGYRFRNEQFNIGANLYGMIYKDQLIFTGAIDDVGGGIRKNEPYSYRAGIEFDGAWKINSQFTWKATAALSQNKVVTDDKTTDIAMSPSTILSNNFTYKPVQPLSFSLLSKYVSRMYLDNTSSDYKSINPYFVHDVQAVYSFSAIGIENIALNLLVNNILNTKYATNGYIWYEPDMGGGAPLSYNMLFPQAGTNFMLGLNIRF
ncbi:TonB-dependent receptor [Sphingobacterium sp. SGG-5]|uniref:TonB-dependent receptor n=1 Tax=Sphingobacterium sp. SGG-5 TaxID=2710881 RepID=UPI0013ED55DC|nr:TonB-dependent receptor [Sphingobacterium sp. SGG-5]NGM60692.1 TonB-dependent receptor [Sphingobacterium sp. SGG-5]